MHHGLIDGFGMVLILDKLCGGVESPYLVPQQLNSLTLIDKVKYNNNNNMGVI